MWLGMRRIVIVALRYRCSYWIIPRFYWRNLFLGWRWFCKYERISIRWRNLLGGCWRNNIQCALCNSSAYSNGKNAKDNNMAERRYGENVKIGGKSSTRDRMRARRAATTTSVRIGLITMKSEPYPMVLLLTTDALFARASPRCLEARSEMLINPRNLNLRSEPNNCNRRSSNITSAIIVHFHLPSYDLQYPLIILPSPSK